MPQYAYTSIKYFGFKALLPTHLMIKNYSRKKSPEKLSVFLQEIDPDSPLKSLINQVEQRNQLQATLYGAFEAIGFGSFASEITIGSIEDGGEVKLLTPFGTIASKLKNKLPTLLNYLREAGYPFKGIAIKVLPAIPSNKFLNQPQIPVQEIPTQELSPAFIKAWTELANSLDVDTPLGQSVKRLLETTKRSIKASP
ncbi:MAG: hypothetical protein WCK52_07880 [Betaproteobacteria bacterium]|jgi:hypothetical protein